MGLDPIIFHRVDLVNFNAGLVSFEWLSGCSARHVRRTLRGKERYNEIYSSQGGLTILGEESHESAVEGRF